MGFAAGPVVGQDAFDDDPGTGVVGLGALPEGGGGFLLLVGQDLAVGEGGVVVDGGVDLPVTGSGLPFASRRPAEDFVAASVGDVAELLDVDVDELAHAFASVAAYDVAGRAVKIGSDGQAEPGQDPVHGRGRQVQQMSDAGRSPAPQDHDLDDPAFGACRRPAGAVARSR